MTTYITTPIYYVNAEPHLGHAYTTIVADTYSRFRRLQGEKVRFQTGTDEHGDKIAEAAAREGVTPKEYVDRISGLFRDTWPLLGVVPDNFIRTTDENHMATVQKILQQVYDQGDIYFDEYSGLYCKGCERFLTEKELVDGKCPDHQTEPAEITEQNYFFRMSRYQQQLIDHIQANPEFITPERYRNEVLSFLSEPLEDLCISRPTSRLTWGIPLPFDDSFVTYVWFDALINYLTGLDYPDGAEFENYWGVAEHLIAKDILKPHAIYWPTMILSLGLPLYKKLHVHGYWNVDETKMSKSIGNVVRPAELVAEYGVDCLRYFTLREMSFGLDASFSADAIVARKNSDLANDLGNLYSRSTAMLVKYTGGVVPGPGASQSDDTVLEEMAGSVVARYQEAMGDFQFHRALQAIWELISLANKYIVTNEPWALAKDPEQESRLHTVLYNLAEVLRLLTLLLQPVMPETCTKMATGLGLEADSPLVNSLKIGGGWGVLPAGTELQEIDSLFPRVEQKKVKQPVRKESGKKKKQETKAEIIEGVITFAQFQAVELRVAEIVGAEPVKKSDRLLKLTVKAPEERVIVAGIAEYYRPEEIVGMLVLIVANLEPVRLMGVESQGMVLAAKMEEDGKSRLVLSTVSGPVAPGSRVA
ncbi:MAG: methionine--tRNA ligase [Proteobacteria bacterium]|nr:methionine--tRNA ligase [Pseudomonadota bacterium]MBU1140308.1 methionine--tRNA ligase [Pseudomonadota bacterium]MBU1232689.1 methionine--tRNA ligase [Pseudomonadota bacterium]MBU1418856.1 methionine--tRNA ligase [Pseudomonadota bacterium]MBU1455720.1 methionine--tRNA ligase [Pseudomonadota bacterium]